MREIPLEGKITVNLVSSSKHEVKGLPLASDSFLSPF